jgi:hypothetical protein
MSVSEDLVRRRRASLRRFGADAGHPQLCAFELLKPLDGAALKKEMARSRRKS